MSKEKPNAYSVFSSIDSLVSKPVMGSDGAASWQEFSKKGSTYKSRGVAPHAPLHKTDRMTGLKSIVDERKNEEKIRQEYGDAPMGSGYTVFKRKQDKSDLESKKRKKLIMEKKRPDNVKYFIPSASFSGWKEDYVFTTRDRGTGYYWDGTDSIQKLLKEEGGGDKDDHSQHDKVESPEKPKKKKKDKTLQKTISSTHDDDLPEGWELATDSLGNVYFFNRSLNKSVWERPTAKDEDSFLPEGWNEGKMKIGEEIRTRPMTAGAGYSSSTSNKVKQKLEVYQRTKSVFKIIKDTEKEIHSLIEESAAMFEHGESSLALEKAKEAAKLEKKLSEQRELNDSQQEHGVGLSFAVWFNLSNAYEKNGMFSESIETYLFLLSKRKFHSSDYISRIRINMGSLYHSQKNYQESIKMYRMALDQLTREDRALRHRIHRMIGNIFVELGRLREAIFDYEAVVMSSDADLETCFNLLLCYIQTGCTDKVKQTFVKMIEVAIVACNSHSCHHVDDADINFISKDGAEMKPGDDTIDLLLSASRLVCLSLRGQYWEQEYQWIRDQIKDKFPSINHYLGIEEAMQYLRENNYGSAIDILKASENKDTQVHAIASINLTFIYSFEGMHDSADEYADIAISSNRFNPSALVNKGNRLFVRNDFEGAKECYLEAINIDSFNFEAIYNLGLAFSRLGLHSDALRSFQKLQLQHANDPRVLYQIANISAQTNDKESTVKWFSVLSSCLPTDAGVFSRLAELCDDDVNNSQRFHNYLESHRLYPSNIDTIGHLAVWFVEHELYEKALYFFRCASVIQPNEKKWKFMMASCYRKLMKTDEAFNIYQSILVKSPSDRDCLLSLIQLCREVGISSLEYENELIKVDKSKLNVIGNSI